MAITVTDLMRARVWIDLAANEWSLPVTLLDDYYLRAEEKYGTNTDAIEAAVRLLAIRSMKAFFAKRADYTQNASDERMSQIFRQLDNLYDDYKEDLVEAVSEVQSTVMFRRLATPRRRLQEYPDNWQPPWSWIEAYDVSRLT